MINERKFQHTIVNRIILYMVWGLSYKRIELIIYAIIRDCEEIISISSCANWVFLHKHPIAK